MSSFDREMAELQARIDRQVRARYSTEVIEEASRPSNVGRMEQADARSTPTAQSWR
jgi:hypothetical protein